ncbi:MAG TPA: hypothetical protein VMT85_04355 [Thermoanaerobaculia bacterium]|nr:hypothetical protein [Thermoanaerobaculia bacterium]
MASAATGVVSLAAGGTLDDYATMRELRFAPVARGDSRLLGVEIAVDDARLLLDEGSISVLEPIADGSHTGLVFEGRGRLLLAVPDSRELAQLRRFAAHPELEGMYLRFDRAVVRATPDFLPATLTAHGPWTESPLARQRRREWRDLERFDVDARLVAALENPVDRYLRADLRSDRFGWVTLIYDELRAEEIEVRRPYPRRRFVESWLSLDRTSERDARGRPTSIRIDPLLELRRLDARISLTGRGTRPTRLRGDNPGGGAAPGTEPTAARLTTCATFRAKTGPLRALPLTLDGRAEVLRTTREGRELDFVRRLLRERTSRSGRRWNDLR